MKRRNFLRQLGLTAPSMLAANHLAVSPEGYLPPYAYGHPASLHEAAGKEGDMILRLAFRGAAAGVAAEFRGRVSVTGGAIERMKVYFFEPGEDRFLPEEQSFRVATGREGVDVLVVWLREWSEDTRLAISGTEGEVEFALAELIDAPELVFSIEGMELTANLLLDKEIGVLQPADFGAAAPGDRFRLAVLADPQGGDPAVEGNHPTRMKIHNAWIEESIRQVNGLDPAPVATLILGDIVDSQGEAGNFAQMHRFFETLQTPILYALGNHETRYRSEFTPGYNMEAFNNYFAAQRAINGLERLLYSLDLGRWHFIVWPDPLRNHFWETHPHYFDWLERDLERNSDRPTVFFQHIPIHPIGINPLINYAESVTVKRTLFDLLARHGNVRYVFSGHVHIPIKASFKTAVSYRGMQLINLPPAGYRPRAFGEEDYAGGPCQGILVLDVDGESLQATFRTVTEEEFVYPEQLPVFDDQRYALWLRHKWELPAARQLINGSFEAGLEGWTPRFVYTEDDRPSNRCEVRRVPRPDSHNALYLYSRKRGYDIPGQDRLPQDINRICQAVDVRELAAPLLTFSYRIDEKASDLRGWCGAYVRVEGFRVTGKRLDLVYSTGVAYAALGGKFNRSEFSEPVQLALNDDPTAWHDTRLHLARDYEAYTGNPFAQLGIDRLVFSLGVWTINDGDDFPYGIYFDAFGLTEASAADRSVAGGKEVLPKPDDRIWWLNKYFPFSHVAGEHRYILATRKMGE